VTVTERNRPVAVVIPAGIERLERIRILVGTGFLSWSGRTYEPPGRPPRNRSGRLVSDAVIEDRR
jgi:antitoxin (DNA-binding transcriptional repressor) of toxin-antitoxin stability system